MDVLYEPYFIPKCEKCKSRRVAYRILYKGEIHLICENCKAAISKAGNHLIPIHSKEIEPIDAEVPATQFGTDLRADTLAEAERRKKITKLKDKRDSLTREAHKAALALEFSLSDDKDRIPYQIRNATYYRLGNVLFTKVGQPVMEVDDTGHVTRLF